MLGKQLRTFAKNELIFLENQTGDCAYLIETGRVLVFLLKDGEEIPLKILGKGEIFGEMSMIDNSPRSASCRALTEVRLATVTQEQLLDRVQSTDPIVRLLMRALLDRLRLQNDAIRGKRTVYPANNTAEMEKEREEALARLELENRIAAGLENDEFLPHYQPIYNLQTGEIVGCEALLRWRTSDGKLISPGSFIDALEESPLILEVGHRMIQYCVRDLVQMQKETRLPPNFFVSVNVSGRQFADPTFVEKLEGVRQAANIPSFHLKLEVTERIMTEGPQAISTLQRCRALGYKIAIDDFGTGFSSLQYLASMPLHDLKVDRSFINQMMSLERSLSIVKTLIYLANALNLNLVAEGIETEAQLALLNQMGVQMGQGFYFSKALPLDEFTHLVGGGAKILKLVA